MRPRQLLTVACQGFKVYSVAQKKLYVTIYINGAFGLTNWLFRRHHCLLTTCMVWFRELNVLIHGHFISDMHMIALITMDWFIQPKNYQMISQWLHVRVLVSAMVYQRASQQCFPLPTNQYPPVLSAQKPTSEQSEWIIKLYIKWLLK